MMMRTQTTRDILFLIFAAVLVGNGLSCAGTEVGNPVEADATVQFSAFETPGALTLSSGVRIDAAWLSFEEVELRSSEDCDQEDELDSETETVVELIQGRELPGPVGLDVLTDRFCRLELELGRSEDMPLPAESPLELESFTVYVTGQLADGSPFVLVADLDDEIDLDATEDDFELTGEGDPLLVGFALDTWFTGIELSELERDGAGRLVVSEDLNAELRESLSENILGSGRLVLDSNRNGAVDGDELSMPLAISE